MKKILIIEDEANEVELLEMRLGENGYQVISSEDGVEGMKMAREEQPDLILLDIFLPKINGFDVCRRLKDNPKTKNIPILVITASGVDNVVELSREAGADDCIRKPYNAKDLVVQIKKLLKE